MNTARPSDIAAVIGYVAPISQGAGTVTTGWIAVKDFHRLMATLMAGVLGASATLDAKFQQATDSSGTNAKDISGKSITQLTKAGSDDGKIVLVNLKPEEMDVAGGFTHVRFSLTVATAASLVGALVQGFYATALPASDNDLAAVKQIVA